MLKKALIIIITKIREKIEKEYKYLALVGFARIKIAGRTYTAKIGKRYITEDDENPLRE